MNKIVDAAIETANSLVGTKEEGNNRGAVIDMIQAPFGLVGQQYCVMFVLYCYMQACLRNSGKLLIEKTASSQTLFEYATKMGITYTDPKLMQPGDIAIYRKFKLWAGHAALITSKLNNDLTFNTIEGNTSNSNFGSQRDGDGIYRRIRNARKINFSQSSFYLRGFISIRKLYPDNNVIA